MALIPNDDPLKEISLGQGRTPRQQQVLPGKVRMNEQEHQVETLRGEMEMDDGEYGMMILSER